MTGVGLYLRSCSKAAGGQVGPQELVSALDPHLLAGRDPGLGSGNQLSPWWLSRTEDTPSLSVSAPRNQPLPSGYLQGGEAGVEGLALGLDHEF